MMMSLLTKVMDVTKSSWNELLDKLDQPEQPGDAIDAELGELEKRMDDLERTTAAMIGTERELQSQLEDVSFLSGELGLRAVQAAEQGRDTVAKQMLEEKQHYDEVIREIRQRYQETRARVQDLVEKLYAMKEQAHELRKRRGPVQQI
ncbi:PspA/IM30 family protein [Paenibacillus chartarius]|uniref:PspA/IM30 family protein n=1 Tax=Paenibacillus chartarius TaxID=747481 RepID=A0ABV6DRC7_9BACL